LHDLRDNFVPVVESVADSEEAMTAEAVMA
jgi:hypothetical protein